MLCMCLLYGYVLMEAKILRSPGARVWVIVSHTMWVPRFKLWSSIRVVYALSH